MVNFCFSLGINWIQLCFDLAFDWILFGIFTRICFVEIAWNKIYPFSCAFLCARDILLDRDRELDLWEISERYICVLRRVFLGDFNDTPPQRRSTHTLSLSHTHTHTHSHPWLANSGCKVKWFQIFFGVLQIFLTRKKNFFLDRQGVTQHPKIFPEC